MRAARGAAFASMNPSFGASAYARAGGAAVLPSRDSRCGTTQGVRAEKVAERAHAETHTGGRRQTLSAHAARRGVRRGV